MLNPASWLRSFMGLTAYEIRHRLPRATLDGLDILLLRFAGNTKPLAVLQIGACDGITNDPLYRVIRQGTAHAILLEPNPIAFAKLQAAYNGIESVRLLPVALAKENGEADFYRVRQSAETSQGPDYNLQFSSFSRDHLLHCGVRPENIEQIKVPTRSLSSLLDELKVTIDLLQIDAEGFDAAVVRMALELPEPPPCLNFEHWHLSRGDRTALFELLTACGYVYNISNMNVLAVRETWLNGFYPVNA